MGVPSDRKAVLGFSGGVDSTAAAVMLKEAGYEVTGLYFDVLEGGGQEDGEKEREYAESIARSIGIDFVAVNVSEIFRESVIEPFLRLYGEGKTPNPCVLCNPAVKFAALAAQADRTGAARIATGHYARVEEEAGTFYVAKAKDARKDQSYMLCRLPQSVLSRLLLPIGEFGSKEDVRNKLRGLDIANSEKRDSQDICFLRGMKLSEYLRSEGVTGAPGNFLDTRGNVIAPHSGTAGYTAGQRKGLGVALGKPVFVKSVEPGGEIVLAGEEELYESEVPAEDLLWAGEPPDEAKRLACKLRYTAKEASCRVMRRGDSGIIVFDEPQRAPAPGQPAVFYDAERLTGSGFIARM